MVGDDTPIVNDKFNSSVTAYFFDCVESYDSHITYPSCHDVKSHLVDEVYFECISSLFNFDIFQSASSRKVKEDLVQLIGSTRDVCSTCARTSLHDPEFLIISTRVTPLVPVHLGTNCTDGILSVPASSDTLILPPALSD